MKGDLISRRLAVEVIESIRGCIWDVDIPSPTVPEYVEHHEQMQMLMRKCDAWLSIIECGPAAQPENKELSEWKEDFRGYIRMLNLPRDDYKGIMAYINEVPPAQPLIRCQDCKHHHYEKDIPYCDRIDYGYGWQDSDFCSRAERREE